MLIHIELTKIKSRDLLKIAALYSLGFNKTLHRGRFKHESKFPCIALLYVNCGLVKIAVLLPVTGSVGGAFKRQQFDRRREHRGRGVGDADADRDADSNADSYT